MKTLWALLLICYGLSSMSLVTSFGMENIFDEASEIQSREYEPVQRHQQYQDSPSSMSRNQDTLKSLFDKNNDETDDVSNYSHHDEEKVEYEDLVENEVNDRFRNEDRRLRNEDEEIFGKKAEADPFRFRIGHGGIKNRNRFRYGNRNVNINHNINTNINKNHNHNTNNNQNINNNVNINVNYNRNKPFFLGNSFKPKWKICSGYYMDTVTQLCCHGNLYTKQAFKKCCGGHLYHVMSQDCVFGSIVDKQVPKCGSHHTYDLTKEFCYREKVFAYQNYLQCEGQLYLL